MCHWLRGFSQLAPNLHYLSRKLVVVQPANIHLRQTSTISTSITQHLTPDTPSLNQPLNVSIQLIHHVPLHSTASVRGQSCRCPLIRRRSPHRHPSPPDRQHQSMVLQQLLRRQRSKCPTTPYHAESANARHSPSSTKPSISSAPNTMTSTSTPTASPAPSLASTRPCMGHSRPQPCWRAFAD